MKRSVLIALLAGVLGLPIVGCTVKSEDDDDDMKLKVDDGNRERTIEVDRD